jgi:hypothetical protein
MTPKEKADYLLTKMISQTWNFSSHHLNTLAAKQCCIVAVDEILIALQLADTAYDLIPSLDYWHEVKKEIELL